MSNPHTGIITPTVTFKQNVERCPEEMRQWLLPAFAPGFSWRGKDGSMRVSDGKHTFIKGVTGRDARIVTPSDTAAWIAQEQAAAVPFNTLFRMPDELPDTPGWELAALDVDAPQGHAAEADGLKSLADFADRHALKPLPLDRMIRNTNHGAADLTGHFLVRIPAGMTVANPLPGVDWCDTTIRPIVFAGSAHKSGRHYGLFRGAEQVVDVPNLDEWPELPEDWRDALLKPREKKAEETHAEWHTPVCVGACHDGMCKAVQTLFERWEQDPLNGESSRHGGMCKLAFALAHFAADGHRGADLAAQQLVDEFVQVTGDESRREEAESAVKGAWRKAGPSSHTPADPCVSRPGREPVKAPVVKVEQVELKPVTPQPDDVASDPFDRTPDTFSTIRAALIAWGVNAWLAAAVAHAAVSGWTLFPVWCRMIHDHPTASDRHLDFAAQLKRVGFRDADADKAGAMLDAGQRVPDVFLFALASPDFHVPEGMLKR